MVIHVVEGPLSHNYKESLVANNSYYRNCGIFSEVFRIIACNVVYYVHLVLYMVIHIIYIARN